MKKQISKPEYWQGFESLCKKLWGEIWGIPNKIKMNGRFGQPQSGVDVYGRPNGKAGYWGIQAKGKSEYIGAKLTSKEIDDEIEKALNFKPRLDVFIIATTANKDVEIEEYVRIKDLDNRENGLFEVLLFCWEDIVDLIEENRDTYNYYVNENQFKSKYDFEVCLNNFKKEFTLEPTFFRRIRRYEVKQKPILPKVGYSYNNIVPSLPLSFINATKPNYNDAITDFDLILENTGSNVIEDWRVTFEIAGRFRRLYDSKFNDTGAGHSEIDFNFEMNKNTYCRGNFIYFNPKNNRPLIQKDNRYFTINIITEPEDYVIPIKWKLLARDFNTEGVLNLIVRTKFKDVYETVYVEQISDLKGAEIISITEKER